MHFKNEFVTHRKIDLFYFATVKKYASQSYVIDFGSAKNTVVESAIDKNDSNKVALREIATVESATFKFFQIDFFFTISDVVVFDVKEIVWHFF